MNLSRVGRLWPFFALLALLFVPSAAFSAEEVAVNGANTAWVLTATALVLFMTLPGLALFYGGLVRTKNVLSILMQCFAITCVVSVVWVACGYSLSFTDGGSWQAFLGGADHLFMQQLTPKDMTGDIPEVVFLVFQMTFAVITPALVIGGFAERVKFSAVLLFSIFWVLLAYVPVCHWVWGGGWLNKMGMLDFAGGSVVHVNAGAASLVAALYLGRRKGFPHQMLMPHNLTMAFTGAAMLWVGWFGFNGGSALAANASAGMAVIATHMAAAAGSLAWMGMEWIRHGKPSLLGIITGMVAGLGTVTPASGYIGPLGGMVIGLIAGVVCYWATLICKQKLHIDDSLDVFPVHGVGGILGTIITAIFAAPAWGGFGLAEGATVGSQLVVQLTGTVATFAWSGVVSLAIFYMINRFVGMRVSSDEESEGLDLVLHDERGYNFETGGGIR